MAHGASRMATKPLRLIVWAQPGQEDLIRDAARSGAFELVAIGSKDARLAEEIAEPMSAQPLRELRVALGRGDADLLWLAGAHAIDADQRHMIRHAALPVVSSEPLPGSITDLMANPHEAETAEVVGLMRHSPGYRAAAEALEQFGTPQCVNVAQTCRPQEGSLYARLFDAMDLIQALCGPAQTVDAALIGEAGEIPETLSALHGHLTANVRCPDRRCASVALSDRGGRWSRSATILGEGGSLQLDDAGFEWFSPDGEAVDAHREKLMRGPGDLVAWYLRRRGSRAEPAHAPVDQAALLALCEAARLSARTGAPEDPRKVVDRLRHP
jgi:hypothetical protein